MTEDRANITSAEWVADCKFWQGKVLTGRYAHSCRKWHCVPMDETTREWPCGCYPEVKE